MSHILFPVFCFAIINLSIVLLGWVFVKQKLVLFSWLMLIASIAGIGFIFSQQHPIIKMLAIIATTFTAMKVIAVAEGYKNKPVGLNFKQWVIFASAWAGMRAQPFETLGGKPLPNARPMVLYGISRIVLGSLFIATAHGIIILHLPQTLNYIIVSGFLLVGFSLVLHFGLLSISAGMWRLQGANTYLLFNKPAKALSLTEFWSKRWNIAFSEMTSVAIFRPLRDKIGSPVALMLAFAFSGVLHELALSVPVNNGYGLPLIYFIIQGALVLLEKLLTNHHIYFLKNKLIARIWVFFWLVIPMPLLFHEQFIKQIVWPLAGLKI